MTRQDVSLSDRYDLGKTPVLLNGTQALVRLMLMQKARDAAAGLSTAGYVSGYRGSPLGGVDLNMAAAERQLLAADVLFRPGLNEDLAATAIWGTQQAELRGEGKYDGVFALWYGKGPGVDRSGDALRHANMAGTSRFGGVVMALGDDHTGESSTTLHQSDLAALDAYIPVLSPAGVQEILDYGLYGFALSRFAGVWTGLKLMKDTVEVTSVVDGDPHRMAFVTPDYPMPPGGLNIRLSDTPAAQEARMIDHKRFAAEAFARANRIDRRVWGRAGAKIGFVAAGKNWLDLVHAVKLLGIGPGDADRLGITLYKIGQTWPLDMASFHDWAEGLDLIVVVEEKRKLLEVQIKEAIFDDRRGRRVYGWKHSGTGEELFPTRYALDPALIAEVIGRILKEEGRFTDDISAALQAVQEARKPANEPDLATRRPTFCGGCPHNTSTKVPEGSRAYAGIGCHYMAQWMDRSTLGYTHMGGEGVNWVGEAPFSNTPHVFQNLGDGTYNHSGILAIREAVAMGTTVTYKILFNDAVAMTGGQRNEGGLTPVRIARELDAMGVRPIAVVHDPKEGADLTGLPGGVEVRDRDALTEVQERFRLAPGVSAIVYVQTCAAEKRRRRRKGMFPKIAERVWINPEVCEGCGDCGVQSNCVSVIPLDTGLGRKRAIDQSSCNADYSCLKGFCPSFVTVTGATLRKGEAKAPDTSALPEPVLPAVTGTHNTVITGVGGTGVVTVGAVLAMAAHLDGRGVGMMEMAGLAQKGGAVLIHLRIGETPDTIDAIRVATGEADCVLGGDLVVTAAKTTLGLVRRGRTGAVVNTHETMTGDFARDRDFRLPGQGMRTAVEIRLGEGALFFDATRAAAERLGDAIFANMVVLGAAWQRGLVPLTGAAIRRAIELNGAGVAANLAAFETGRLFGAGRAGAAAAPVSGESPDRVELLAARLIGYQNARLAARFRALVARAPEPLREAVAESYHKLLARKDEYEVARLHLTTAEGLRAAFEGDVRPVFHLAPPLLSRKGPAGRPGKLRFGPWVLPVFRALARMKGLRDTPFDPFGYSEERRAERRLIAEFEADMETAFATFTPATCDAALALARLPQDIRGFGPVKAAAISKAAARRGELLAAIRTGGVRVTEAAE
ncbi:MAG: indolepyruvate ferredoxin oxidoreductase family protein [Paracoccaceae bacterium]